MSKRNDFAELQWLAAENPETLLAYLRNEPQLTRRKRQLLCVACCRRAWHQFTNDPYRHAVEIGERAADDAVPSEEAANAERPVRRLADTLQARLTGMSRSSYGTPQFLDLSRHLSMARAALATLADRDIDVVRSCVVNLLCWESSASDRAYLDKHREVTRLQTELLRDLFGNPFRQIVLDPRWLTSTVVDLSRVIYEERAFDRLPILGDALMDAGCDSDAIIQHCRGEGPHARGCWVVDALLGKS